ncbi:unnamed protein product, partial [Mesorhabditis spiculigera]
MFTQSREDQCRLLEGDYSVFAGSQPGRKYNKDSLILDTLTLQTMFKSIGFFATAATIVNNNANCSNLVHVDFRWNPGTSYRRAFSY